MEYIQVYTANSTPCLSSKRSRVFYQGNGGLARKDASISLRSFSGSELFLGIHSYCVPMVSEIFYGS